MGADLTLLTTRNTLPALAAARSWANSLRDCYENSGGAHRFGVLLVDEAGRWPKTPTSKAGGVGVSRVRAAPASRPGRGGRRRR